MGTTQTITVESTASAMACFMTVVPKYIVPGTAGSCAGTDFASYWSRTPDVVIRIYKDPNANKDNYVVYDPAKHASSSFAEYHDRTQPGTDVRTVPDAPWVGIILDD